MQIWAATSDCKGGFNDSAGRIINPPLGRGGFNDFAKKNDFRGGGFKDYTLGLDDSGDDTNVQKCQK